MSTSKKHILKEFRTLPGVGQSISEDLWGLGFRSLSEIKDENPEELYEKLCVMEGHRVDRCMLYVFRCINYYLNEEIHNSEKLKWWNWKDRSG